MSDPTQLRLFGMLALRRGDLPENSVHNIARAFKRSPPAYNTDHMKDNIAFLMKYTGGPNIQANQVSVSVIDVRSLNNRKDGHKAIVCIHNKPGDFEVVV